ncbi:MAG: prolyl oligopeptidase family serine peptidase, partial [Nevskiales bacterium]
LRNGVNRAAPQPTGFHQRVYTSAYTLGEGVSLHGVPGRHGDTRLPCEQYFNYLGKYQPYGVYIPSGPGPHGVQMVLHGCEANHASQINQPNMQQQFGEGLNRILVSPLGRGPYGFYSDISERDVLDALADVEKTYDTDPERVFMGGYSMGGYGAMRLAALYPDRFAGVISWVGATGDVTNAPLPGNPLPDLLRQLGSASGIPNLEHGASIGAAENIIDFLGNLQHIPGAYLYTALDELVHVTSSLALAQRLDSAGIPYRFFEHPVGEHFTLMALDDWQKEADATRDLVRVRNPSQVRYRTDLSYDFPEYGITHNRAYWVSGIESREEGVSEVALRVPGCGGSEWTFTTGTPVGLTPVPWIGTERLISGNQPVDAEAAIEGNLDNVSALELDADATCLQGQSIRYALDSDGPATIRLSDGRELNLTAGRNEGNF